MGQKLKAYVVQEEYEFRSAVCFAHHNVVARREGANQLDNEFDSVSCRRAPEFDDYAPGPVPPTVLVESGWWFECLGCYTRVGECDDDEDFDPVDYGDQIFCTPACMASWEAKRDMERRITEATIQWLEGVLFKSMPGARLPTDDENRSRSPDRHVYVDRGEVKQAILGFRFPGCKTGNAHIRFDQEDERPHVSVCNGDMQAFEAWKASGYSAPAEQET